jgi:hypothetical protein
VPSITTGWEIVGSCEAGAIVVEPESAKTIVSGPAAPFAATIASRKVHSNAVQTPSPESPALLTVKSAPEAAGAKTAAASAPLTASSARNALFPRIPTAAAVPLAVDRSHCDVVRMTFQ